MHIQIKRALCATSALAGGLLLASSALAQSTTGSATVEELVVTGSSGPTSLSGVIEQTAPKTRTTIDQEFIARQMPGQTVADSLNVVPGYNFTNNDAYGNSGGNIRLRSFDCARISFQWDGMQLNDSGNYACFTNQVGDSEIVSTADVAQGTTDVDAPSASATGGAINYRTKVPDRDFHVYSNLEGGSFNYKRGFLEVDSGEVGPWGTRMFVAGSYTDYDKFKGPGELKKTQFNARIYQPLGDNGDFASVAFHWNKNRNNFYNNPSLQQWRQFGMQFDEDQQCNRLTPVAGTAQNENNNNIVDFKGASLVGSCTGYYNLRINPSDTGNIRGQFKYHLRDNLIFTFDPNFQYVLANGGGFTALSETDGRIRGAGIVATGASATSGGTNTGGAGKDLNGDGDTLDTVTTYSPNNTNTRRYGINSSLIWEINENNRVRLAYALDYARHRQTGEFTFTDPQGNPLDVFGGKDGHGPKIATADGSFVRGRDRFSIAQLNMFAAEYVGHFMDDSLEIRAGVRAPFFKRELNNFCYSQNGSSNVLCTTQPVQATLANGNVLIRGQGTTQYIAPYKAEKKYDDVLPNVGVSYKLGGGHSVYASYAEGLSAPRTDNLYTATRGADGSIVNPGVQPETTQTIDVGYRYTTSNIQATVSAYKSDFQNRIVSSFDQDLGVFIDRNIGSVEISGVDAGVAWQVADYLTYIGNVSYNHAIVQSNSPLSGGNVLPTAGKRLVETPDWQWFQRVQWEMNDQLSLGVQAKWVGRRYSTDVNDEKVPSYATVDADLRWLMPKWDDHEIYLQFNVKNLFDNEYLGSISSVSNAIALPGSSAGTARYSPGSPRTFQVTLHVGW